MPKYDSARRGCSWRRVDLNQCARRPMCDGDVHSGNPPNSLCVRRTRNPLKLGPRLAYVPRPELFSAVLNHFFQAFRARFDPALVQGADEEHLAALRMPTTPHARCAIALPPAPRRRWHSAAFPALATRPTHPLSNHAIFVCLAGSFWVCLNKTAASLVHKMRFDNSN